MLSSIVRRMDGPTEENKFINRIFIPKRDEGKE
jgi:hypothetical protein